MSISREAPAPDPEHLRLAVFNWLDKIPATPAPTDTDTPSQLSASNISSIHFRRRVPLLGKRRRSHSPSTGRLLSPPLTIGAGGSSEDNRKMSSPRRSSSAARTPSPKKRKTSAVETDLDITPRPGIDVPASMRVPLPPPRSDSSSSYAYRSDASSQISRRSSPTKQMARLELRTDGVETRSLWDGLEQQQLPAELRDMVRVLRDVQNGLGIISQAQQAAVTFEAETNTAFQCLYPFMFAPDDKRDELGPTPLVSDIRAIHDWANHFYSLRAGEAEWNADVHSPLLKLAAYGGRQRKRQLVQVANCTSAPIIPYYLPTDAHSKKVDYVIVVDPAQSIDANAAAAGHRINNIRSRLPELSINHCFNETLLHRPVAVSIETKRGGDNDREAQLQLGTWLAAQWNLLGDLIAGATPPTAVESGEAGGRGVGAGADDTASTGATPPTIAAGLRILEEDPALLKQGSKLAAPVNKLACLPFLPAVIVHGHDWSFVASTREGQKTVLWTDCPFGSTRDAAGIYKTVIGIQHLKRYVENTFWPWYKDAILGIE